MKKVDEMVQLSEDERIAVGNILFGNQEKFSQLTEEQREEFLEKMDGQDSEGVNRGIEGGVFLDDRTGPKISFFKSWETTFSEEDSGGYGMTYLVVVGDKAVTLHVRYGSYSDDDSDGSLAAEYGVRPASELEDAIREIKKSITADAIRLLIEKVGSDDAFELATEALLKQRSTSLTPKMD